MDRHHHPNKQDQEKMAHELAERLTHAPIEADEKEQDLAKGKVSPKYEVRIQTEHDPILEETARFRELAKEVDDRYDDYVNRAAAAKKDKG